MDIEFVNHASLLLKEKESYFLTDPWYVSPAFGGWIQNPSPKTEVIEKLLSIPASKLNVIISHGHDDHLDDFLFANTWRTPRSMFRSSRPMDCPSVLSGSQGVTRSN